MIYMQILEVDKLSKAFKSKSVLKDVSFKVQAGEVVALVGKNGAGKSTLLKLILGLLTADSGQVTFLGKKRDFKEQIGVMLQEVPTIRRIKVKEIIQLWRSYYAKPLDYDELLKLADLASKENSYLTELSGGQKKRLYFALALAGNPQILFLDEPTVAMDSLSRANFWKQVDSLRKEGKTFIITSHYPEELERIANRFLILTEHRLVFNGSLGELQAKQKACLVSFASDLKQAEIANWSGVVRISEQNHHYFLQVIDLPAFLTDLLPKIRQVTELTIKPNGLAELLDNLGGNYDEEI